MLSLSSLGALVIKKEETLAASPPSGLSRGIIDPNPFDLVPVSVLRTFP